MYDIQSIVIELDRLKCVHRQSVISDGSRHENSAEHSWHLAMMIMALKPYIPKEVDVNRALEMALAHDVCEIGAGDVCAYSEERDDKVDEEALYMQIFSDKYGAFGEHLCDLWEEYESQQSLVSQWVRVVDKLQPFLLNISTKGHTWRARGINADMVRQNSEHIRSVAPIIHKWMMDELDKAEGNGWLETTPNSL